MTPTARTLKRLREEGWTAGVVEKWNPHVRIRQDFLGCIDIIAVREGITLGVQATSASNQSSRYKKIGANEAAKVWLSAGNRLQVWGWSKRKVKRGGKLMRWDVTVTEIRNELGAEPCHESDDL